MKTRIIAVAVAVLFALAMAAMAAQGPRGNAGKDGKAGMGRGGANPQGMIVQQLGLSKEQAEKVLAIAKQFRTDAAAVRKGEGTPAEKTAKIKSLRDTAEGAIMTLLTPDQQAKARERNIIGRLLAPWQAGNRAGIGVGGGIIGALARLNLTDEQKKATTAILKETQDRCQAIRTDTTLTPEQKRDLIQPIRKESMERILSVLTPEQRDKLNQILPRRNGGGGGMEGNRGAGGKRGGPGGGPGGPGGPPASDADDYELEF